MKFVWINAYPYHAKYDDTIFIEKFDEYITLFQHSQKANNYNETYQNDMFECSYGLFCTTESRYSNEIEWNYYADYVYSEIVLSFLLIRGLA